MSSPISAKRFLQPGLFLIIAVFALNTSTAFADEKKPNKIVETKTSSGTIVTVNGVAITNTSLDDAIANITAQGVQSSPQLRDQVLNELIVREVLNKEAMRLDMDKTTSFKKKMEDVRKNLLAESLWADYSSKHPISEQDEQAEYDRQKNYWVAVIQPLSIWSVIFRSRLKHRQKRRFSVFRKAKILPRLLRPCRAMKQPSTKVEKLVGCFLHRSLPLFLM
jgi:SurA N-terminal domain